MLLVPWLVNKIDGLLKCLQVGPIWHGASLNTAGKGFLSGMDVSLFNFNSADLVAALLQWTWAPSLSDLQAPSWFLYKSDCNGGLRHSYLNALECWNYKLVDQHSSFSLVKVSSLGASSGDMAESKEQRIKNSGKYRVVTWWKAIMQRHVCVKTSVKRQLDPPPPVYITAADVMKSPRETMPASDAKFHWRMWLDQLMCESLSSKIEVDLNSNVNADSFFKEEHCMPLQVLTLTGKQSVHHQYHLQMCMFQAAFCEEEGDRAWFPSQECQQLSEARVWVGNSAVYHKCLLTDKMRHIPVVSNCIYCYASLVWK